MRNYVLEIMDRHFAGERGFTHHGIEVKIPYSPSDAIREVILKMDIDDERAEILKDIAYDLVTTLLSETTNNDACNVTIQEVSGHHDNPEDEDKVVVTAKVIDELS